MTTRRQFLKTTSLSLLSVGAAGLVHSPAIAAGASDIIRYNSTTGGLLSYPELADALGLFDGVSLELVGGAVGGPASIQNVATNQIDFGYPFNASLVSARAAGVKVKAVIGYQGTNELSPSAFYVLEDSPIRSARDLIGRKVGLNTLGAAYEAFLDVYLIDAGLTPEEIKQVTRVVIPSNTFEQSLRSKQVDLVLLTTAALHHAQTTGGGGIRPLFSAHQLLGNFTQASYVVREKFIEEKPEVLGRFVDATARAIIWAQTHEPTEVIAVLSKYLTERNRAEEVNVIKGWITPGVANAGGVITPNEFSTWVGWLETTGEIAKGSVPVEDLYTNQFNPFAGKIVPASEAASL